MTVDSPIPHDVEIIRVHAVDPDPGFDGKVQYQFSDLDELANANIAKQFAIDPQVQFFILPNFKAVEIMFSRGLSLRVQEWIHLSRRPSLRLKKAKMGPTAISSPMTTQFS